MYMYLYIVYMYVYTHMYTFREDYIHTHYIHTYIYTHNTYILNDVHTCKVQHVQRKSRPTDPKSLAQVCTAGVE